MILGRLTFYNTLGEELATLNTIERTETIFDRMRGLLGKKYLDDESGLWIVPCNAIHTFGMKFPIDLIYFDKNLKIIGLKNSINSKRFSMLVKAKSVLEIREHMLNELNIKKSCYAKWNPYS
tara:strand:- start:12538 stop:12903 length:366 start_codon:yes stop_codon:yes gene_type:complete